MDSYAGAVDLSLSKISTCWTLLLTHNARISTTDVEFLSTTSLLKSASSLRRARMRTRRREIQCISEVVDIVVICLTV